MAGSEAGGAPPVLLEPGPVATKAECRLPDADDDQQATDGTEDGHHTSCPPVVQSLCPCVPCVRR